MSHRFRKNIVGKRFFAVSASEKLRKNNVKGWPWISGYIRAASLKDSEDEKIQVLLEYDDKPWTTREWVSIYSKEKFGIFLIEVGLYWAPRIDPFSSNRRSVFWPALTFSALASTIDYNSLVVKPIEFVMDGLIAFVNYDKLTVYENWDQKMAKMPEFQAVREATERLVERQAGLRMMMDTPSILYGCRVKVYRTYGIAQWYTAVIVGFNDATQELTLMDDTVLEEHFEDPRLVHMKILGDGVVNGILRGENVGTRRRNTSRYCARSIPQTDKSVPKVKATSRRRALSVGASDSRSKEKSGRVISFKTRKNFIKKRSRKKTKSPKYRAKFPGRSPENPPSSKTRSKRRLSGSELEPESEDRGQEASSPASAQSPTRSGSISPSLSGSLSPSFSSSPPRTSTPIPLVSTSSQPVSTSSQPVSTSSPASPPAATEDSASSKAKQKTRSVSKSKKCKKANESFALVEVNDEANDEDNDDDADQVSEEVKKLFPEVIETVCQQTSPCAEIEKEDVQVKAKVEAKKGTEAKWSEVEEKFKLRSEPEVKVEVKVTLEEEEEKRCGTSEEKKESESDDKGCASASRVDPVATEEESESAERGSDKTERAESANASTSGKDVEPVEEPEERAASRCRVENEAPLSAICPLRRMDDAATSAAILRFPDDRSDSGLSSLRSGSCASGDERSGSRSSALSSSDEPPPNLTHQSITTNRSPLSLPPTSQNEKPSDVWRDPSLLLAEPVRHVESVQHQSLLMSHPAGSAPPQPSAPAAHYPPPPTIMGPHQLSMHPLAQPIYSDMIFGRRFSALPAHPGHPTHAGHPAHPGHPSHPADELLERERGYSQDRLMRERREQEARELEKQKERQVAAAREREKAFEREKFLERERLERERQERKKLENQKQQTDEQIQWHFDESLRLSSQKKNNSMTCWNLIPGHREQEDRKRAEQEHQHQQRILAEREHQRQYFPAQIPPVRTSNHPPPPAHSRINASKPVEKPSLPKAEPNFSMFHYPGGYQPITQRNYPIHREEVKQDPIKQELHVTKHDDREMSLSHIPPPSMSEIKNTVIVKHDAKNTHGHLESMKPQIRHSPSPKQHYLSQASTPKVAYDYQNPHQSHPQQKQNLASISKVMYPRQRQSPRPKPATMTTYPYPASMHYAPATTPPKPKVSSPAPPHIYGKPTSGISTGMPICRPHDAPLPLVSKPPLTPSPYTPLPQHYVPPPTTSSPGPPPPAHRTSSQLVFLPSSSQTQPLDLGVYSRHVEEEPARPAASPQPVKVEPPSASTPTPTPTSTPTPTPTSTPTPTPVSTPIPTPVPTPVSNSSQSAPSSPKRKLETNDEEESKKPRIETPPPTSSSVPPAPSPIPPASETSNSPRPSSYPVHKLKKAWLQRHSGEPECTETSKDIVGSGSCVSLPITLNSSSPVSSDNPITTSASSFNSIGSMAVNSIIKVKTSKNRKTVKDLPQNCSNLNGHTTGKSVNDDETSSSENERKSSPTKRVPTKLKRKKGANQRKQSATEELKRKKLPSISSSESERDSGSEKDSDSGSGKKTNGGSMDKNGSKDNSRKRGRRPKGNSSSAKNDNGEGSRDKKPRDEPPTPQRDPFQKPPFHHLKKSGESFLQDGPCFEVAPKLPKCRECRWTPNQRTKSNSNIFCRFYAFRRLRYTKNGQLAIAGFSDPHNDASQDDIKLWLPNSTNPPTHISTEMSRFLLEQVGDQFCDLLQQEKEAISIHMAEDKSIAWKRVVQGVREMCDVCETTLFNFHWACGKCGFVVCIDCYKGRKNGSIKIWSEPGKDRDDLSWLLCTNKQPHEQNKLMLTQIIAGDALMKLGRKAHEYRALFGIPINCSCPTANNKLQTNGFHNDVVKSLVNSNNEVINGQIKSEFKKELPDGKSDDNSPLNWLADVALSSSHDDKKDDSGSGSDSEESNFSTLRELLIRPAHKANGSGVPSPANSPHPESPAPVINTSNQQNKSHLDTLDQVLNSVHKNDAKGNKLELLFFKRRSNYKHHGREPLPHRIMTYSESKSLYPDVPHSWLCEGKLLRLLDSNHSGNYSIFQDQWKRGQPVIVSNVTSRLDKNLWTPESFINDFGEVKNDLINCATGNIVPNQPMRKFWDGFENLSKRLKDDKGNPMLLKLKDWPPGEDFAEMLPTRFSDLTNALPLGDYTQRNGCLNLASRLPDCFVRPDLGPKMYIAYGSAKFFSRGTTNLHLDVSDAVNVLVYVGLPKDAENDEHIKEAFRAIDEGGCDIITRRRARETGEIPGALWHIYAARDADKIRDLLNKVAMERGARLEPHHDPIHDQSWYLDGPLREKLYREYGVEGYAIAQCKGDAVFIPAGAPHQVRNLHNCIKVAEDFVSPENVSHCFHLTQEFRDLSERHQNHEDKLQIKNIMYHAVKDSISVLSHFADTKSESTEEKPKVSEIQSTDSKVGSASDDP